MNKIQQLEEMINSFPPTFDLLKKSILSKLKEIEAEYAPVDVSVTWSVSDFEWRAKELEFNSPSVHIYDRSKFEDALKAMIASHDAEFGITWVSVDWYLNSLCKF